MSWSLDASIAGRAILSVALEPGARCVAPEPRSVVVRMAGEAYAEGNPVGPTPFAVAPGSGLVAGPEGCMLGAIAWDGPALRGAARIESTAPRYFGKYGSFQAHVTIGDDAGDWIAPWELYHVRMIADTQETVELHVHHRVTNVLFVPGPAGVERGYLLVERDGAVEATPLVGGDRAIVRPGRNHHIVPVAGDAPIEMVVFNDDRSSYEHVDDADFHIVATVPWSEVAIRPRANRRPRLTVVS